MARWSPRRTEQLAELHREVQECTLCIGAKGCSMEPDPLRVPRALPEPFRGCDVMLVGEAIGSKTQRLSGWPYLEPDGSMLTSGRTLDGFLARFGYTIRPDGPGRYAYSTDLVRRWPQKPNGKTRKPRTAEIANCLPWLEREIQIVRPRVLVLLGGTSAKAVFGAYLGRPGVALGDVAGGPHPARIGAVDTQVYAVPHPSPLAAGRGREAVYERVGASIAQALGTRPRA